MSPLAMLLFALLTTSHLSEAVLLPHPCMVAGVDCLGLRFFDMTPPPVCSSTKKRDSDSKTKTTE